MSNTITFVTGNANKLREVVFILSQGADPESDGSHKVGRYSIVNTSVDLEEIQGTIEEVSIYKAKKAAELLQGPVLVEDTCLGYDALNGLPGPYIKWFAQSLGLEGLIKLLAGFESKAAKAYCTFGYCPGPGQDVVLFQGVTQGTIAPAPRGPTTFGWDSIFQPSGYTQTYAEMDKAIKNSISHRYKALDQVRTFLMEKS